jgi:EME1/MUS81, C-terminal
MVNSFTLLSFSFSFSSQIDKVGEQRALAVVNAYPTLLALYEAYDRCGTETERKLLLSKIPPIGERSGRVGPKASETIYKHLYQA